MKIIFLDIDGVLNNTKYVLDLIENKKITQGNCNIFHIFDPICVDNLANVVKKTGAQIVLSSTWRGSYKKGDMDKVTIDYWLNTFRIPLPIDITPYLGSKRGYEIQSWLDNHPDVENFVILDDDTDMVHLMNKLAHCKNEEGLTKAVANEAISILGG